MQSYAHFTLIERESLSAMYKEGKKVSEIARALKRSKSTVSRELKRNGNKDKSYNSWRATSLSLERRKSSVRRARLEEPELKAYVVEKLNAFWSPEGIVARWKELHSASKLSWTTIYSAVKAKQYNLAPKKHLRRRGRRKKASTQTIKPVHTIHERPKEIEERSRLGDMEGDTVMGAPGKGLAVTIVDRQSRMLYAERSNTRESERVKEVMQTILAKQEMHSLTLDRGSEFAKFQEIETESKVTIYFADPHSPWQRGTNENTNGLLRFFFPKGTDFRGVTDEQLQQAVTLINNRPRKCLDWLSPIEFIRAKCCT